MLVQGVVWKAPNFKLSPAIAKTLDPARAQSQIPSKVLLVNDIHLHFLCSIQDIGTLEMDETLEKLRANGVLKSEHQHLEVNGLTHIQHIP